MEQAQVLTFKDTKAASLTLKSCGCSATSPFHCFGPAVRPYCLIHIIRNGKGIFQIDGKTYYLQKGQGFFIPPDVLTFYQADEKDPWEYLWVGFGGSEVPDILKQVGLSSEQPVFSCFGKNVPGGTGRRGQVDLIAACPAPGAGGAESPPGPARGRSPPRPRE